ncbi:MAG: SDR family oxidoreductase [Anaerolineae bacterium]|nr:SDR family oxidoreductase [Anaerolineae bacterium]MDW8172690.1 SDR family oxidoreductase [Anaerolineae bacterium]
MQRLQGKVCVITGGASGIGRACAARYAQEGGRVVVADINKEGGQAVVEQIRAAGGQAVFQPTDVSEPKQLEALLQRALDEFGDVHVWHNNAFKSVFKTIVDQTLEEFDDTIRVSLRAYWYGSKLAVTHMLAHNGGVILNTASVQSYFGEPGFSAYQVAKGGILSLTRSLGVDHAPKVRAVAIAPGFIITPAHDGIPPETIERVKASIPAKRGAQPEEVAALAAFLASDEADYITATGIIMDGGYLGI